MTYIYEVQPRWLDVVPACVIGMASDGLRSRLCVSVTSFDVVTGWAGGWTLSHPCGWLYVKRHSRLILDDDVVIQADFGIQCHGDVEGVKDGRRHTFALPGVVVKTLTWRASEISLKASSDYQTLTRPVTRSPQ